MAVKRQGAVVSAVTKSEVKESVIVEELTRRTPPAKKTALVALPIATFRVFDGQAPETVEDEES